MRALEASQVVELVALSMSLLSRRRAASGEQTGGRRFGLLRLSAAERARRGVRLPSESEPPGRGPPLVG